MTVKWRIFLVLISFVLIQSFAFAQDTQYQPLIEGMEAYRDNNYEQL
ncbi:MAG: hypothetical protein Q8O04_12585 [Deltaproteobacteria bacterium]|nr:hypothetical protein [Deltaproteobacteria bacterium]